MIASSVNGALGNAGLLLMLAATTFGASATVYGIRAGATRTLRASQLRASSVLLERPL